MLRGKRMDIRDLLIALILGVVEGLTEFIPVSSTGHLIIVDDLLFQSSQILHSSELANTFKVVIQFGSVLAAAVYFWQRLKTIGKHMFINPRRKSASSELHIVHIGIGLLPALVLGLLLEPIIDHYLFRVETVIFGLIAGAFLMMLADQSA